MSPASSRAAADRPERVLAEFFDGCWEPGSAIEVLWDFAGGRDHPEATPHCLRVLVALDGRVTAGCVMARHADDAVADTTEPSVHYHWSLWRGPAPTREELVALVPDQLRASPEP